MKNTSSSEHLRKADLANLKERLSRAVDRKSAELLGHLFKEAWHAAEADGLCEGFNGQEYRRIAPLFNSGFVLRAALDLIAQEANKPAAAKGGK